MGRVGAGWFLSDEIIFEAAQVAAIFNFTDRLVNALGWKSNEEYYALRRGGDSKGGPTIRAARLNPCS